MARADAARLRSSRLVTMWRSGEAEGWQPLSGLPPPSIGESMISWHRDVIAADWQGSALRAACFRDGPPLEQIPVKQKRFAASPTLKCHRPAEHSWKP